MSLASLWVTWKRHHQRIGYGVVGLLLFAAGWQAGRVTSPYWASHPIVFEEAPGVTNNGSAEALGALQEAGLIKSQTAQEEQQKGSATAEVAAATTASPTLLVGETTPLRSAPEERIFVGSKNSNLYHHKDCSSAKRIKEENQIWWPTKEAAEAAGYTPSQCTTEKLNNT